jgi:hypothetical protein
MAKATKRGQRIREWALYQFMSPVRWGFEWWMAKHKLIILYCVMGNGIGDALALSTILKAINKKCGTRGIVFSMYPDLFLNNPLVVKNLGYHCMPSLQRSLLKSLLKSLRGSSVICFGGEVWTLGTSPLSTATIDDRRIPGVAWINRLIPDDHINVELLGAVPAIFFSDAEKIAFARKFEGLPQNFGMIKATIGLNRPKSSSLKDWSVEGFAQVIDQCPEINWVQVGEVGEPALSGAINLLGKTTLREVLWLIARSKVLLSVEGFMTHASAAFDVPTVVPFTGIHDAKGLLYPCSIAILPDPSPPCAPCWQEECTTQGMPCRNNISVAAVLSGVRMALMKFRPVDYYE